MTVTVKPNFGKTDFLYQAPKGGDIDIYPEFSGTAQRVSSNHLHKLGMTQRHEVARDGIAKQDQLAFKPMAYQNTYAIAVPKNWLCKNKGLRRFQT